MRISIVLSLLILLVFSSCGTAFAYERDIGYSKIHPASPFYFLKGIREKLEMEFAQTDHIKMIRHLEFAQRRLREAKTLISIKQEELISATLERYSAHMNQLSDKMRINDPLAVLVKNSLPTHLEVLQQIYQGSSNPRSKLFLRSAMHRIIRRADAPDSAKTPICHLFAKEATTSAQLNDVEKVVLLDRSKLCFESGKI